ncbi:MAG: CCA tRNA nucleotidyltransferase [Pleomorphochaeta sp.]
MKHFPINKTIKEFATIFNDNGYKLYIVGGAVRDYILNIKNEDYDFATDATPEEVISLFRTTIPTGIKHGTVTVLFKGNNFEVTTFRNEFDYKDGRRPDKVKFIRSLEEDLKRRDFTINALAADAISGIIIDNHKGLDDLKNKRIKAIGIPQQRFEEDGLRIMRACRFASKLDFEVDNETKIAMKEKSKKIINVSHERIKDELFKLLKGKSPIKGINLLEESDILIYILPELLKLKGLEQGGYHKFDAYTHTLLCVQASADLNYPLDVRLAALFHDIGKAETQQIDSKRMSMYTKVSYSFYNHELIGSKITKDVLSRLKASNNRIDKVSNLVKNHMFNYIYTWSDGAVKRFINRVGYDNINELFMLRMCDQKAIYNKANWNSISELEDRIAIIIKNDEALSIKDLAINGNDLISLGIKKGPLFSKILNYLLNTVLDDPNLNKRDKLLEIALSYYKSIY